MAHSRTMGAVMLPVPNMTSIVGEPGRSRPFCFDKRVAKDLWNERHSSSRDAGYLYTGGQGGGAKWFFCSHFSFICLKLKGKGTALIIQKHARAIFLFFLIIFPFWLKMYGYQHSIMLYIYYYYMSKYRFSFQNQNVSKDNPLKKSN